MLRELLTSHSGRRIGVALALCAMTPLLAFAGLIAREAVVSETRAAEARLTDESRIFASALAARIASAATLVDTFASRDVGDRGELVGAQVAASPLFTSFALVDRDGLLASGINTLRPSPAQLAALESGDTILLAVVVPARAPTVFLARRVRAAGIERVGYFELAAPWLWSGLPGNLYGDRKSVV